MTTDDDIISRDPRVVQITWPWFKASSFKLKNFCCLSPGKYTVYFFTEKQCYPLLVLLRNVRDTALKDCQRPQKLQEVFSGRSPYCWQLDVAEALFLGPDCVAVAGTGATKTIPLALPLACARFPRQAASGLGCISVEHSRN